jgi:glycosyltransferase involved in cell wall biosynthesis
MKVKIIRSSTIALTLDLFLSGQLSFLNNYFHVIAVSGEDEHLANVRKREKVATVSVPMQRHIAPFKDLISLMQLYRLFRKEKPQIVHSITPKAGLLCMGAAYMAKVPIRIHTFTGLIFPSKKGAMRFVLSTLDKLLCSLATNVYPEGKGVKQDLVNYNITKKPLKVLANGSIKGIDLEYFNVKNFTLSGNRNLRTELSIEENDFVFVFVGRLVKDKGINELITAFKALQLKHSPVKLLLVGPFEKNLDPLEPETIKIIETHPGIITAGFKEDVRPFYAIANALVFPSYREGFPNVVLEAAAMELPIIATDINGCNEIVENDINGLIIPPKHSEALQKAMGRMISDENFRQHCASASREIIVKNYRQELIWKSLLDEYVNLLHRKEIKLKHVSEIPETII